MAKRPSLTKTVAEAAFFNAWFAKTPEPKVDQEAYQRIFAPTHRQTSRSVFININRIVPCQAIFKVHLDFGRGLLLSL